MIAALFDTNIIIDLLADDARALAEMAASQLPAISVMSWMEVMVGIAPAMDQVTRAVLANFDVVAIDDAITERAVEIRRASRIKLTDAIIWATAQTRGMTLVTRNTKDFPGDTPGIRVPYTI